MSRLLPPRVVRPRPEVGDIVRTGSRRYRVTTASPVEDLDPSWWVDVWEVDALDRDLPDETAWRGRHTSHDRTPLVIERFEPPEPCRACHGSGEDHIRAYGPDVPPCPSCHGTGEAA